MVLAVGARAMTAVAVGSCASGRLAIVATYADVSVAVLSSAAFLDA